MIQAAYFQSSVRKLNFSGEITYLTGASLPFSGEQALSFSISEGIGEGMLLGGAFSASFSLSLYDRNGDFTFPHSPKGAQVRLFLEGNGERNPLGVFTVSRAFRDEHAGRLTLSGTDALGTAFESVFSDTVSYPASLKDLVCAIAAQAGFSLTGEVPNGDILIASSPAWGEISLRQAMGYAAEAAGCFAAISREGTLQFFPAWPQVVRHEIAAETVLKREYGETVFGPLEGLGIRMHQAHRDASPLVIPGGDVLLNEQNSLTISGNPLFSENGAHTPQLGQALFNQLRGLKISQGKISWRGDPSFLLGDRVRVWDANGSSRELQITAQTLSFSQGFSMQSDCRAKGKQNGVGRLFTSSGALNAAMLSGEINGALIRDGSIAARSLLAGSITALQLAADSVTADQVAARSVTAQKLAAQAVGAEHLSAEALTAVNAQLKTAHIGWAEIDELTAAIANIASGKIQNADIDFAHIKDLAADTAIITKGVGGELYISRLAVTEANMVSLSVGQLLVKGQDGGFYALSVDESGKITTEKKQVGNGDVQNLSINAGEKLIEGSVTAATLNAKDIFADSAIIRQLIAANIDVDTLFAREATIAKLNAVDISGNEYLRLSVKKAVDDISIGGRNLLTKRPTISTHLSSNITRTDYGFTIAPVDQDTFLNITTHEDIIQGEEYTLSMECEGFSEGEEWTFYIFNQWGMDFTLKNGKVSYTFQSPGNMGKSIVLDDKTREKMPSGTVTVKNLKLEKGNKATDWTAAPEDLETRVLNAETAITETAEEIKLKASKTEVDNLTGRVKDTEAQIAVQAGEIQMAVTEVNNISVGGRNLLLDSGREVSNNNYLTASYAPSSPLVPGEEYTMSVCFTPGTGLKHITPHTSNGARGFNIFIRPSGTGKQIFKQTFVMPDYYPGYTPEDNIRNANIDFYRYPNDGTVTSNTTFHWVKIEKGNKATDWTPAPEDPVQTLKNTAMTLNADGIEMNTTGYFRLYANDGKNSMIKLGGDDETANFSVTETGKLGAISGEFTDGLKVRNYPVWTRQNIIISSSQPTNVHDVLWIQPLQGVQQTSHSFTNDGSYHFNSGEARSYTLTPQSNDVLTPGGSYEYSLSFPMTLGTNTSSPKNFTVSAVISNASGSVTLTGQAVSLWGWGNVDIKLTGTSSVNLCASSGNITAAVTVSGGGGGNTSMYIPGEKELILTSKNTAASSAGAQTCSIHYIQ